LILGGGFAGSYVARYLGRDGAAIVNPDNFMLFTPLLPETASGTLEPRHAVVPLRQMCPHAELMVGRAAGIDLEQQVVRVEVENGMQTVGYRQLVVALGAVSRVLPIPGLAEHGLGFKDLADAIYFRNHVLRRLEVAATSTAEGHRRRELTFVDDEPQRWVLVDAAPRILPEIPTRLGEYAAAQLARRGVELRVETTLDHLEPHAATLSDGERILTSMLVWTAGVRPARVLTELGLPLDEQGRIEVDGMLRVQGHGNVWALGDSARVPNAATPEKPDPPTSQHAQRQVRRLAKNLRGEPRPYRYRSLGQAATLGRYKGIAALGRIPIRGFLGWFGTRTYHLYQLPLFSRKLRVVTDWTVALFFRRDIVELGMLGHPRGLRDV
jgi:NADH:quinone reductase (non-electrogenic)